MASATVSVMMLPTWRYEDGIVRFDALINGKITVMDVMHPSADASDEQIDEVKDVLRCVNDSVLAQMQSQQALVDIGIAPSVLAPLSAFQQRYGWDSKTPQ